MMRTCAEIAKVIGYSKQRLHYHLLKTDAPKPQERMKNRRIIKYWDTDEVKKWLVEHE